MKFTLYALNFLGLSALISFSHVHASGTGVGSPQMGNAVEFVDPIEHGARRSSASKSISGKGKSQSKLSKVLIPALMLATLALSGTGIFFARKRLGGGAKSKQLEENAEEIAKSGRCSIIYVQEAAGKTFSKIVQLVKGDVKDEGFAKAYLEAETDPESELNKMIAEGKLEDCSFNQEVNGFEFLITAGMPDARPKVASPLTAFMDSWLDGVKGGINGMIGSVKRESDDVTVHLDVSLTPSTAFDQVAPRNKDGPILGAVNHAMLAANYEGITDILKEAVTKADETREPKSENILGFKMTYTATTAENRDEVDKEKPKPDTDGSQVESQG